MKDNKTQHLTLYADPSHAWLKVSLWDLKQLKIDNQITSWSYIDPNGKDIYLEEDVDMVTYLTTLKKHGLDYVIWEDVTDNQSIIRTYRNY
jgi:hypothetical protein